MYRNEATLCAVLLTAAAVLLVACSRQPPQPETKGNQPSPKTTEIWVSETTGKEYRVRVENDVFHADWLNISPDLTKHGAYIRSECKKQGDKWIGASSSYLPCTTQSGPKPNLENWCHLETKFEIDSVTAQSIAGQGEALIDFDCMNCKILKSEMKEFQWSPKEVPLPTMPQPTPENP